MSVTSIFALAVTSAILLVTSLYLQQKNNRVPAKIPVRPQVK